MMTLNERWEQGMPHDPRSIEVFKAIERIDREANGDFFGWKSGGDGDNGEILMFILDQHFEEVDLAERKPR